MTLITDQATGQPKGYGFVTMDDDVGARRAILALNGMTIDVRTISVRFAEEKAPIQPSGIRSVNLRPDNRIPTLKPKRPRRT